MNACVRIMWPTEHLKMDDDFLYTWKGEKKCMKAYTLFLLLKTE